MGVRNIRHGRLRIRSGDPTPLELVADFDNGDFNFTENFPTNIVRSRGRIRAITAGDEQPLEWGFSVSLIDFEVFRTLRDKVWAGLAETITGLTTPGVNLNVPLSYDYEQNSLQLAAGEPVGTKQPPGVPPAGVNDFSEEVGAVDIEGVIRVQEGTGAPGSGGFNVEQAAADPDRDVVYDAVGQTTFVNPGDPADCSGGRKTFTLIFDVYDDCDPPVIDPATGIPDPASGTITESLVLDDAWLTTDNFAEADEADTITFGGQARGTNGKVRIVPGGLP
ncbi:MAG: hypothetical protein R3246_15865 [Acidimicrobiia bacterium]|nr:hypothetical protein [Acidimicrobiia bacterium]